MSGDGGLSGEGDFSRDQLDAARGDGAGSDRDFSRDPLGAAASDRAGGDTRRYAGTGSLESRGTGDRTSQRDSNFGSSGTQPRPANSNYAQLNRDAAARQGGYQNHQRRTTALRRQMNRGGGMSPRRR